MKTVPEPVTTLVIPTNEDDAALPPAIAAGTALIDTLGEPLHIAPQLVASPILAAQNIFPLS